MNFVSKHINEENELNDVSYTLLQKKLERKNSRLVQTFRTAITRNMNSPMKKPDFYQKIKTLQEYQTFDVEKVEINFEKYI